MQDLTFWSTNLLGNAELNYKNNTQHLKKMNSLFI